jgi:carbamoyl-phosphate synthase small subunit
VALLPSRAEAATLLLADGRYFKGRSFGASGVQTAEVVFNTTLTGYQEVLTDPSYEGAVRDFYHADHWNRRRKRRGR